MILQSQKEKLNQSQTFIMIKISKLFYRSFINQDFMRNLDS